MKFDAEKFAAAENAIDTIDIRGTMRVVGTVPAVDENGNALNKLVLMRSVEGANLWIHSDYRK